MHKKLILVFLVLFLIYIIPQTYATDAWPMFLHDPQHTGRSQHAGPESNDTKWIFTPPGTRPFIRSGPIISSDGTIYVSGGTLTPRASYVYAISRNGTLKWNVTAAEFSFNLPPVPSAIAPDGTIYLKRILTSSQRPPRRGYMLYALNPNGTMKWFLNHSSFLDLFFFSNATHFITESINPGIINIDQNGIIYFTAVKSRVTFLIPSFTIFRNDTRYLFSIYPNGTLKWLHVFSPEATIVSDAVIGHNGIIYITLLNKTRNRDNLLAFDSNGSVLMNKKLDRPFVSSLSIGQDGTIYIAGLLGLTALAPNGTIRWERFLRAHTTPVISSDRIIVRTNNPFLKRGTIQSFDFNGSKRSEFIFSTNTISSDQPVIDAKGNIYFLAISSPNRTFYVLDSNSTIKWSTTKLFFLPLAIGNNTIYMSNGTSLYAIGPSISIPSDTIPPANVTDLIISEATTNSLTLAWTAPGDDGNVGTATAYDIRYSTSPITEINWDSATQATGEPAPQPAGSLENFVVTGLAPGTTYHLVLKTSDEVPNLSELSNVAVGITIPEETCNDGLKNQDETDVDCGGSCGKCEKSKSCLVDSDCQTDYCNPKNICSTPLETYSPVLFMHPDEGYLPRAIFSMLNESDLWFNAAPGAGGDFIVDPMPIEIDALVTFNTEDFYMNMQNAEPGSNDPEPTRFDIYQLTVYGREATFLLFDEKENKFVDVIVLQYWFFYPYNNGFNNHEGDWEMIQILVNPNTKNATFISYSHHECQNTYAWLSADIDKVDITHPKVFVSKGGHASYNSLKGKWCAKVSRLEIKLNRISASGLKLYNSVDVSTISGDKAEYEIELIDDNTDWVSFQGRWGELSAKLEASGPTGPGMKDQWDKPISWTKVKRDRITAIMESPVNLHAYDSQGRHVGLNETGGIEIEIPGTYIFSPSDNETEIIDILTNDNITFVLEATDKGKFDFTLFKFDKNTSTETIVNYTNVNITNDTIAILNVIPTNPNYIMLIDEDGDGIVESIVEPENFACNGICEPLENDTDNDGFSDSIDNCPFIVNPNQLDNDNDGLGDVCDPDDDNDGILDIDDLCPLEISTGLDANSDGCKDTIEALINVTQSLNLKQGIENSLDAKLQNTKDALEAKNAGKRQDAVNKLEAFINEVEAQRNKAIINEQANLLIAMTNNIITQIL